MNPLSMQYIFFFTARTSPTCAPFPKGVRYGPVHTFASNEVDFAMRKSFSKEYLNKILKGVKKNKQVIIEVNYSLEEHLRRNKKRGGAPEPVKHMYNIWHSVSEKEKIKPDILITNKNLSIDQIVNEIMRNLKQ